MAKGWFEKFGGFTISFAEITVKNELGNHSPLAAEPESADNLSPILRKVKPEFGNLSTFFYISARVLARLREENVETLQIRQVPSGPFYRYRHW